MIEWLDVAVLVVAVAGSAFQVLSGIGFGLIASPLLILALGREDGIRIVLIISIVLNAAVLARSIRFVRLGDTVRLLIPAALLVVPAVFVLGSAHAPFLTVLAGSAVLFGTVLVARGRPLNWMLGSRGAVITGAASGLLTALTGVGGPPVALFVSARRWSAAVARGTMQAFFLPLNLVTLMALGPFVNGASKLGWAVAGVVLGAGIALLLTGRISETLIRRTTLALAGVSAATLVANGIVSLL
ncbi:sulfite exporter TauE/SafE family protein [Leifsonia sp. NPDC058292]|uniref:sulfite exporter TauE/SafE family protein n=1 Tax=Leifsonia sp. NPDC058292 TaxID=3346428 RepID=UPI0036DA7657